MHFDPENHIVKLCAAGMEMEFAGKPLEASRLFQQAWTEASTDFEKFTAAHYVARHQDSAEEKLKWDQKALELALGLNDEKVKNTFPSLYLNIAKGHEDLKEYELARKNYQMALSYVSLLPEDGYGRMISSGIMNGLKRLDAMT